MTWEYLHTRAFDARCLLIAGYLHDKVAGKHIVDLDCGHAPLVKYLPRTYASYYANDTHQTPETGIEFEPITDVEAVERLTDRPIDILIGMGYAQGHLYKHELESPTMRESVLKLAENKHPQIIVLETVTRYENSSGDLAGLVSDLKGRGYQVEYCVLVNPQPVINEWSERIIYILRR